MQTQKVLLTKEAKVLSTEGVSFIPDGRQPQPIISYFPFLEHLWPQIQELPMGAPPLSVPFVACPGKGMPGYYHFDFQLKSITPWAMLMTITCQTEKALHRLEQLQKQNIK